MATKAIRKTISEITRSQQVLALTGKELTVKQLEILDSFEATGSKKAWDGTPLRITIALNNLSFTMDLKPIDRGQPARQIVSALDPEGYFAEFVYYGEYTFRNVEHAQKLGMDAHVKLIPNFAPSDTFLEFAISVDGKHITYLQSSARDLECFARFLTHGHDTTLAEINKQLVAEWDVAVEHFHFTVTNTLTGESIKVGQKKAA
jgi:hypothetical protein